MRSLYQKRNSNGYYCIKKVSMQVLLYSAFFVWIAHGGRLLRYNGCMCGIENIPQKDIFQQIGKYSRSYDISFDCKGDIIKRFV